MQLASIYRKGCRNPHRSNYMFAFSIVTQRYSLFEHVVLMAGRYLYAA